MISSPVPGAAKLPVIRGVLGAVNVTGVFGTETEVSKVGTSSSILAPEVVKITRSRLHFRKYFVKTM